MRALYLSAFAPTLGTGRALRTYTCVRALAALGPVDLAYVPCEGLGPSPEYQAIANLEFIEIRPSRRARRALRYGRTLLAGVPNTYARGVSPELVEVGRRLAGQPARCRVVVGDPISWVALGSLPRERPVIYNAHNIESERRHERHGANLWEHLMIRRLERQMLRTAAESWMVSRADVAAAAQIAPAARLRYVPNVVPAEEIRPRRKMGGGHTVAMIADFSYPPNRSGLGFLRDDVMPRVWRQRPDARLVLVGRGLEEDVATDPRIEVRGFVEDLNEAYDGADCIAVPLLESAGTPLKFVEALAYGVPIVATPQAARGLEAEPGIHYREGGDAGDFAEGIVDVLQNGAAGMVHRSRELAEDEYSIRALAARIA